MRRILLLVCLALCSLVGYSAHYVLPEDLVQRVMEIVEEADDETMTNAEDFAEETLNRLSKGLDLNRMKRDDYLRLGIFSDTTINGILRYKADNGRFQSVYELNLVPYIPENEFEWLKAIAYANGYAPGDYKVTKESIAIRSQTFYGMQIEKKAGFTDRVKQPYLGSRGAVWEKLFVDFNSHIGMALIAEKDEGEKFFGAQSYNTMEHSSFYLCLSDMGILDKAVVGDYRLRFGQGLVLGGGGGAFTSSLNATSLINSNFGITESRSLSEVNYFRGVAATLRAWRLSVTPFASYKHTDANLSDAGEITSFKTDGLHRTEKDAEKSDNITETIAGGNITAKLGRLLLGATGVYYKYSDTLHPKEAPYTHYRLSDTDNNYNLSLDYSLLFNHFNISGEAVMSGNGGFATINSLSAFSGSLFSLLISHRYYDPAYSARFANSYGKSSYTENEHGVLVSAGICPSRKFAMNFSADVCKFPWVKYAVARPSVRKEFSTYLSFKPNKLNELRAKYRLRLQEKNHNKEVAGHSFNTLRLIYIFGKAHSLSVRITADGNTSKYDGEARSLGGLAAIDITKNLFRDKLMLSAHYALFNAVAYDNRLYLYEQDTEGIYYVPMYYGKGHRIGIFASAKITSHIKLSLKYCASIYTDGRESIGSTAGEVIDGNVSSQIRGVLTLKW